MNTPTTYLKVLLEQDEIREFNNINFYTEEEYDDISSLAAQICNAQIVLITLIEDQRLYIKSHLGISRSELIEQYTLSLHAKINSKEVLIFDDMSTELNFIEHDNKKEDASIIYLAGIPFYNMNGAFQGTLSVIDHKSASLDNHQIEHLKTIAKQIENLIKLKKNNESLTVVKERYSVLKENSMDAVFLLSEQELILDVNEAACQLLGFQHYDLISKYYQHFEQPTQKESSSFSSHQNIGFNKYYESLYQDHKGALIPVEVNKINFSQNGKVYKYCIARDITHRKRAEYKLKESETNYKSFIDSVKEGVYCFEMSEPLDTRAPIEEQIQKLYTQSHLKECNAEFLQMYHIDDDKVILGKSLAYFHDGRHSPKNTETIRQFIHSGYRIEQQETIEPDHLGIHHHYSSNLVGIFDDQGLIFRFWGTITDITKLKEYENELVLAKEIAEEKERLLKDRNEEIGRQNELYQATNRELADSNFKIMEVNKALKKTNKELDNFVYRVSHDLRSPIASCLALVSLSQDESDPQQLQEYLSMQAQSLQKLDKFIRDILDYSRNTRKEADLVEVDLKNVIQEIVVLNSYDFNKTQYSIEFEEADIMVCDVMRLQMVLNNIITNAFKYSAICVDPIVNIAVKVNVSTLTITVKDNGIGIPEKDHQNVFKMFYRATSRSTGSGLGLYIVKEALDNMRGSLVLDSKVGKGTTITVCIPNMAHAKILQK